MRAVLMFVALCSLVAVAGAGVFTVTDIAWFQVKILDLDGPGHHYTGRFKVALFGEMAPMTVMNFVALTRGHKKGDEVMHYKDTFVHRVVQDFVIQMGDITDGNGLGGKSIYGDRFNDENFTLSHRSPGWVSMANHGKDTNSSQFFILLTKARWLDGKHVVFGKVIEGYDVISTVGDVDVNPDNAKPMHTVRIIDCGVITLDQKYELSEDKLDSTVDL